jgi:Tfp pilus assembly protein PilN
VNVTVAQFWWLVLAIGLVVILVVAVLLLLILQAARRIDEHAGAIWNVGKNIAANTVQIWQLQQTNATAGQILATAQTIAGVAESIDGRLERLPAALPVKGGGT